MFEDLKDRAPAVTAKPAYIASRIAEFATIQIMLFHPNVEHQ
jgi:hypothetical protein